MTMAAKQTCFISSIPLQLGRHRLTPRCLRHGRTLPPSLRRARHPFYTSAIRPMHSARYFRAASTTATALSIPPEPTNTDDTDTDPETEPEIFHVTSIEAGKRLDKMLATRFPSVSRSYLQTLLDDGHVLINGNPGAPKSRKTTAGETVEVRFVTPERELPITPEDIPLDILYEDEHLVAINKPAGMVVHPAPGNWTGTLVHALTFRYASLREMGGPRPGIVHRLDKGTSGVLIVGLTAAAQRGLMNLFASRQVLKEYVAITVGNPAGPGCVSRTISEPIGRSPTDRLRMAIVPEDAGGRSAKSRVRLVGKDSRGLLHVCRVEIESGRTHQIRVHLRHAEAPVLGDELYGAHNVNKRFRTAAKRAMLHAERLKFEHPVSGAEIDVRARVAEDMRTLVGRNGVRDLEGGELVW